LAAVKTAISIDKDIYEQVEDVARELEVSRSRVVGLAREEYLRRRKNRRIEEQMDAALAEISETAEDRQARAAMKRKQKAVVGRESW
jgi:metal-responsive CopG/Arc/MetJ family transcriptional regulator